MSKMRLTNNNFLKSTNTVFETLRKDIDFTDVTLVCEDGQQVEAHKVILASSSQVLHSILRRNKHVHPLIYMRGVKSEDLVAIVDFLYYGEANIYQENLDKFLNIAEELDLKGLYGKGGEGSLDPEKQSKEASAFKPDLEKKPYTNETNTPSKNNDDQPIGSQMTIAPQNEEFSGDMKELDRMIEAMLARSENMVLRGSQNSRAFVCQVCGKEGPSQNMKRHVEANHLTGIVIPCNLCEKTFRSRHGLTQHNSRHHI